MKSYNNNNNNNNNKRQFLLTNSGNSSKKPRTSSPGRSMISAPSADLDNSATLPTTASSDMFSMGNIIATTANSGPTTVERIKVSPNQTLDKDCRLLIETIDRLCSIPASEVGFTGTIMTSEKGRDAIKALTQPDKYSILKVPVDLRSSCKTLLERTIDVSGIQERRDLLCTAAMPGSGKTVMLWFNTYWFVEKTQGIAVEVTFNDDQSCLYLGRGVKSKKLLKLAIAVRILHRLLLHLNSSNSDAAIECDEDGSVVKALLELKDPLDSTLKVVRSLLGAPSDTKVLLCVDELSKSVDSDSKDYTTEAALQVLTQRLDSDKSFFLAVSALGAEDVVRLSTGSNRHLMLQTLGPLWYTEGFNPAMIHLLPDALRPFYREDTRQSLPYRKCDMELYDELSQLLTTAAGHPRRMESLFRYLEKFGASEKAKAVFGRDKAAGILFVHELALWLHHIDDGTTTLHKISEFVNRTVVLPSDYSLLVQGDVMDNKPVSQAIEELATYCALPFTMPNTQQTKKRLGVIFSGVSQGFCQLVSLDGTHDGQLLAFIPMPVLEGDRPDHLLPRGEALFKLHDAILGMYKSKHDKNQKGKDLEKVAVASFLLMTRCRHSFTLGQLCESGSSGVDLNVKMNCGPDVMLTTVDSFPKDQTQVIKEVQDLVQQLKSSDAPGMIIQVKNRFNVPGDFYGIFKTMAGGFACFRVQCKNWFLDSAGNAEIVKEWRKHDNLIPKEIKLKDGTIVPFASLLFASNKLQKGVTLKSFEGVITIAAMRTWLPTAAHALQTFSHLREIFGWHRECHNPVELEAGKG